MLKKVYEIGHSVAMLAASMRTSKLQEKSFMSQPRLNVTVCSS